MAKRGLLLPLVAALALPITTLGASAPALAKNNTAAAIVGGLIAGAAIGAAVSNASQPPTIIVKNPPPPPPRQGPWANAFNPKSNVTCYPVQQACYLANGAYSGTWTRQIFGK